ncbi:MAG: hypothetical protein P4L82_21795 [Ancalomicrobiaceae bacterium]|nr:hypothetical protein [Ancalomicrobiaceae bacterium]
MLVPTVVRPAPPPAPPPPPTHPNFARIVVQAAPGDMGHASYLRLGKYVSTDEASKVTGLKTTTTSVTDSGESTKDQAQDKIDNDPNKDGDVNQGNIYSATSQNETSYKHGATENTATDNNGILLYTTYDLNENVEGQVLAKYGKGQTVEVETADSNLTVKAGAYNASAAEGIYMTAGKHGAPANMEITSYGYIKQTSYGDLNEWTYGNTLKKFQGETTDWFFGNKRLLQLAAESSFKLGVVTTCFVGLNFSLNLAGIVAIKVSGEININISAKFQFTMGPTLTIKVFNTDWVWGADNKIVWGASFKSATADVKVLQTTDLKIAPVGDFKMVGTNGTIANFDVKVLTFKATTAQAIAAQALFETKTQTAIAKMGSFDVSIKNFLAVL